VNVLLLPLLSFRHTEHNSAHFVKAEQSKVCSPASYLKRLQFRLQFVRKNNNKTTPPPTTTTTTKQNKTKNKPK
jgi:hypothetical protein